MTPEERAAAKNQMMSAGIDVLPSKTGGFEVFGLTNADLCWAYSEELAWSYAWGFFAQSEQA